MARDALERADIVGPVVGPFTVSFAVGTVGREAEFRLRYQVFAEEYGFEPLGNPDRLERDAFDDISCACLLRDARTGQAAASQRLILPDRLPPPAVTNAERLYQPLDNAEPVDFASLSRRIWAETSRTTVAPPYRWGSAATDLPAMVVLSYATVALAQAFGRSRLFSLSEPRIARLTRRMGVEMVQVGQCVDFHGPRALFEMNVERMRRNAMARDARILESLLPAALVVSSAEERRDTPVYAA